MKKLSEKAKAITILGCGSFFMLLFFILILLLLFVDNQSILIGGQAANLGLYELNHGIYEGIDISSGAAHNFDVLSDIILYVSFIFVAIVAGRMILQVIKNKSFKALDTSGIFFTCGGLILVVAWLFFNNFAVNYRPVLEGAKLESSFPSTHVMFVTYICLSCAFLVGRYLDLYHKSNDAKEETHNKRLKIGSYIVMGVLIASEVATRLLSTLHWFTDIIGGFIFGLGLFVILIAAHKLAQIKIKNQATIKAGEQQ